jgi:hypothetical protein
MLVPSGLDGLHFYTHARNDQGYYGFKRVVIPSLNHLIFFLARPRQTK